MFQKKKFFAIFSKIWKFRENFCQKVSKIATNFAQVTLNYSRKNSFCQKISRIFFPGEISGNFVRKFRKICRKFIKILPNFCRKILSFSRSFTFRHKFMTKYDEKYFRDFPGCQIGIYGCNSRKTEQNLVDFRRNL